MGKRKVLSEKELKELVLPAQGEVFGRVIKLLGNDYLTVKCSDGKSRLARIRGKLKRRIWIRENDVVLISPWDFKPNERGDVVWRYTLAQIEWLKANGHIPQDF
ncbi:MAG: translation initiation factor eIF-1A [Nitrososphaerales archaeon]